MLEFVIIMQDLDNMLTAHLNLWGRRLESQTPPAKPSPLILG
jgi:hypothetical protein